MLACPLPVGCSNGQAADLAAEWPDARGRSFRAGKVNLTRSDGRLMTAARRVHRYGGESHILVLCTVVGVIAGLGALAFRWALGAATQVLLVGIGGYTPATTIGEGGGTPASDFARPWAVPLTVALGGLIAGVLVHALAPEARGHGTDAAIHAIHHDPGGIRARVAGVKLVASAITIGSGGSAGREGPTAQISAGAASTLARWLRLPHDRAQLLVIAGMAAGIAAIFKAPLGGAMLGVELLYRKDLKADALMPCIVASVIGYVVYGTVEGFTPIFGDQGSIGLDSPWQFGWMALLGLCGGAVARLYAGTFYGVMDTSERLRFPRWLLPCLAGFVVGVIGLAVPGVLGTGYGTVQEYLGADAVLAVPVLLLIATPFAKILATALSIGSGGSGGIFGPGMVIGATLGAALWRILTDACDLLGVSAGVGPTPAVYVIVGMAAVFGSVSHAPIAMLLMVAEMTGNLALVPMAMLAIAAAALVVGETTIYRSQLETRDDSPPQPGASPG